MKTIVMAATLLLSVASVSAWAQASGNTPDRRPTPTAEGVPSSRQSSQTATSGQKTRATQSGSVGRQSSGNTSSKSKSVNQGAAGVPNSNNGSGSGSSSKNSRKPNNNH